MFNEADILSQLPPAMATDLVFMMYEKIISGTPLFSELSKDVTTKLCLALQPYPAMRGDCIMREQEPGAEMFIVVDGEVSISCRGIVLGTLGSGSFFGETAILDANNNTRKRTAVATVASDLSFLTKDSVDILSENYPSLRQQLFRFSKVRSRRALWRDQPESATTAPADAKARGNSDGGVGAKKPVASAAIRTGCKMIVVKPQSSKAGRVVTVVRADWHGMVKVCMPTPAHGSMNKHGVGRPNYEGLR